jgi:hypothetical protein
LGTGEVVEVDRSGERFGRFEPVNGDLFGSLDERMAGVFLDLVLDVSLIGVGER